MQDDFSERGARMDPFLRRIVTSADMGFVATCRITLISEGAIISGDLIGSRQYYEEFAAQFASGLVSDEAAEQVRAGLHRDGAACQAPDGEGGAPHFIHLRDMRIVTSGGGTMPSYDGVLWRGRINTVSGFFLGSAEV